MKPLNPADFSPDPPSAQEFASAVMAALVNSPDVNPPAVVVVDPERPYALAVAQMIFDSEDADAPSVAKFVLANPEEPGRFYAFAGWMDRLQDSHCGDLPSVIRWAQAKAAPAPGWNPLVLCLPTRQTLQAMAILVVEPSRILLK